ncbi:hypothetical protein L7F22_029900 [Adiantum nelumboides]|nr:hypothetical protein [Adiantum nelumboides]
MSILQRALYIVGCEGSLHEASRGDNNLQGYHHGELAKVDDHARHGNKAGSRGSEEQQGHKQGSNMEGWVVGSRVVGCGSARECEAKGVGGTKEKDQQSIYVSNIIQALLGVQNPDDLLSKNTAKYWKTNETEVVKIARSGASFMRLLDSVDYI